MTLSNFTSLTHSIFYFALILCACTGTKKEYDQGNPKPTTSNYETVLVADSIITFDIDHKTSLHNSKLQYIENDSGRYLAFLNRMDRRILFFNMETRIISYEVKFEKDGPNGIGEKLVAFHIMTLDSIIIRPESPYELCLVDTSGTVKKRYHPTLENSLVPTNDIPYIATGHNYGMMALGGNIVFYSSPDGWQGDYFGTFEKQVLVSINIQNGSWRYLDVSYPLEYYETKGYWHSVQRSAGTAVDGNKVVLSFGISHYLDAYENGKISKHFAGSEYLTNPILPPFKRLPGTFKKRQRALLDLPLYFFIRYDPYRRVYYRFVLHPHEDESVLGDINRIFVEKPFSIIILNEKFEKIGETMMPQNKYYTVDNFVGRQGLYISNNHPDNPGIDEDKLSYTLLKLKTNDI